MEDKKDYRKPGRGGFSQRRGYYGQVRGFNSRNFGGHTWTFYEPEQWENFQNWMKEEKERKKRDETKYLLKGVDELMRRRLGKRKERKLKKDNEIEFYSSSSDSGSGSSSEEEVKEKIPRPKRERKKGKEKVKPKKEWMEKKKTKEDKGRKEDTNQLPMKELLESLGRIEDKIKSVESRNRSLEIEIEMLQTQNRENQQRERGKERVIVDVDSETEKIQEIFQREDEEGKQEDKWRMIQSEYRGKDGTAKLKEWCTEHEIPYKNKDSAMMAVMAAEGDR